MMGNDSELTNEVAVLIIIIMLVYANENKTCAQVGALHMEL